MDLHSRLIPLHLNPMGLIEAFTRLGADLDALLRNTDIDKEMLEDTEAKISYMQQSTIIRNGIRLCDRPGLGLLVGQLFDWNYCGTVGYVVHCSPSLHSAAEAMQRFGMIAQPYYAMHPRQPRGHVDERQQVIFGLECYPYYPIDPLLRTFQIELRLATMLRLFDLCGNKSVADPSVRVFLDYPEPRHADLYRTLPCTSVKFGCDRSYIATHYKFVTEPFRLMRRRAFNNLIRICEEELRNAKLETTYTSKVRWHLHAHFNRQVTFKEIAEVLGVTLRTLSRRLAKENTTFRDIAQDVRMELTAHHLRHSKLSVDEIAAVMGFSSASSLRRTIRNWSGNSTVLSHARTSESRSSAESGTRNSA